MGRVGLGIIPIDIDHGALPRPRPGLLSTYWQVRHIGAFGWSDDKVYCGGLTGVDFDNRSYAWAAIVNQDDLVYAAFELN
jgi:hypothetical protein